MKFLVEYRESRKLMSSDTSVVTEELIHRVKEFMNITENFVVQYFDAEWNNWLDVEVGSHLEDKCTLKCVVLSIPQTSTFTDIPSSMNTTSTDIDLPHLARNNEVVTGG